MRTLVLLCMWKLLLGVLWLIPPGNFKTAVQTFVTVSWKPAVFFQGYHKE